MKRHVIPYLAAALLLSSCGTRHHTNADDAIPSDDVRADIATDTVTTPGGDTLIMAHTATYSEQLGREITIDDIAPTATEYDLLVARLRNSAAEIDGVYSPATIAPTDNFTLSGDYMTFYYSPGTVAPAKYEIIKIRIHKNG